MKWDLKTREIFIMIMLMSISCVDGLTHIGVYGYSLSNQQEFQITSDESDQRRPAISQEMVVWMDKRHGKWDIYGYNLSTKQEFQITSDESDQRVPEIYGNIVVWTDERNGNRDIYGYNFSTKQEFQITSDESDLDLPAIYGNIVICEDERNNNRDIYGYNLSTFDKDGDGALDRIREYLDQSSLVAILVYASAFSSITFMGDKIFNSVHKRRSS